MLMILQYNFSFFPLLLFSPAHLSHFWVMEQKIKMNIKILQKMKTFIVVTSSSESSNFHLKIFSILCFMTCSQNQIIWWLFDCFTTYGPVLPQFFSFWNTNLLRGNIVKFHLFVTKLGFPQSPMTTNYWDQ